MSYSFNFIAANKPEAKQKLAAEWDKTISFQPSHAKDRAAAEGMAAAMIDLLQEEEGKSITVSAYGSLSGNWSNSDLVTISNGSASVNVGLTPTPAA